MVSASRIPWLRQLWPVLAVLIVNTATLHAQALGAIRGQVRDQADASLPNATARIDSVGRSATSDRNGEFTLGRVPAGRHTIIIVRSGYEPHRQSVIVQAGDTTRLMVHLTRLAVRLDPVLARAAALPGTVAPAQDIVDQLVLAGAKSEVLQIAKMDANLAEKTGRQVFARVPGLFVYDMDGSGNQINISTRGLDPHRSWEMNVRQDGVLVNSDMYGYPASHYSPPLEGIERMELVRGTAALQYGAQFGGLLNYVTKSPDTTRAIGFSSINSAGSYGLASTYDAIGGRVGRLTYYGYVSARRSSGYRENGESRYGAQFLRGSLALSPQATLHLSIARSAYRYQLPGPLTDSMFHADARSATRSRNWYSPDITVPAASLEWQAGASTRITAQVTGVMGDRSSVQFIGFANVPDVIDPKTGTFAPRQVDVDNFMSRTAEVRVTHDYHIGSTAATLATGVAAASNDMRRRQQGRGTTGADYDLSLSSGDFGRDMHFRSRSAAVYAENLIHVTARLSVIPGFRLERGETDMTGRLSYYDPASIPHTVRHTFPLFGVRGEFRATSGTELYGGWSQAYRPMILKDLLPESAIERTDPNIKDARGWTIESGVRGARAGVTYEASLFAMRYDDRFGAIVGQDPNGTSYLFKTNVGSTLTKGVELRVEAPLYYGDGVGLRAFTATSYFDARYQRGTVVDAGVNQPLRGRRVEGVPEWIARNGLTLAGHRYSATVLASHVGSSFADPLNTIAPTANGARGRVPGYTVFDANAGVDVLTNVRLGAGVSNLLDARYFTKRPTFYPGPGIWPSDGVGMRASLEVTW